MLSFQVSEFNAAYLPNRDFRVLIIRNRNRNSRKIRKIAINRLRIWIPKRDREGNPRAGR